MVDSTHGNRRFPLRNFNAVRYPEEIVLHPILRRYGEAIPFPAGNSLTLASGRHTEFLAAQRAWALRWPHSTDNGLDDWETVPATHPANFDRMYIFVVGDRALVVFPHNPLEIPYVTVADVLNVIRRHLNRPQLPLSDRLLLQNDDYRSWLRAQPDTRTTSWAWRGLSPTNERDVWDMTIEDLVEVL